MSQLHRVFVSFHHANDHGYKRVFELKFGNRHGVIVPGSPDIGDIDPNLPDETIRRKIRDEYLRQPSVTVVLIGTETWKRRHIDWEISSSLRNTLKNPRAGLLGLLLPSHADNGRSKYSPHRIPPRLYDNCKCDFAKIYDWTEDPETLQNRIHQAYLRKSKVTPDNSRPLFKRNRSGDRWSD